MLKIRLKDSDDIIAVDEAPEEEQNVVENHDDDASLSADEIAKIRKILAKFDDEGNLITDDGEATDEDADEVADDGEEVPEQEAPVTDEGEEIPDEQGNVQDDEPVVNEEDLGDDEPAELQNKACDSRKSFASVKHRRIAKDSTEDYQTKVCNAFAKRYGGK